MAKAAARRRLFFLDSYAHRVTKGQLVFSASSTAASPGCRCVSNPAGAATPVPIKTGEGTTRIAVVQSERDVFLETPHIIPVVLPHCCLGTQGNYEVCPLYFFLTPGSQPENKVSAQCQPALCWCMTVHFPCAQVQGSISATLSLTAAERCAVRHSVHCAVTLTVLSSHFAHSEKSTVSFSERAAGVRCANHHTVAELLTPWDRTSIFPEGEEEK